MQNLNYVEDFDALPDAVKFKLKNNSVFVSQDYLEFLRSNIKLVYFFNQYFIVIVGIKKRFLFKYSECISEIINLSNNNEMSHREFLDEICDILKNKYSVAWLTSVSSFLLLQAYPTNSIRIPFGSYILDLSRNETELFNTIHQKHRNSIRRAERNDVIIKFGKELLDDYILLDQLTWKKQGIKNNNKIFIKLVNFFNANTLIGIAYKNNIPQAGVILFFNSYRAYYLFGASRENPEPGSMNLLHWECIKRMKNFSVLTYDFVGARIEVDIDSKYYGIQKFKERFGGDLHQGFMFKIIFNKFIYKIFKILLRLKNVSYNDIIDQELNKWKELNLLNNQNEK